MTWREKAKEWGGGDVSFLSDDGECVTFVIVGEPVLIEGKYKGQPTQRIGCPVITMEGFSLLIVGKRVFRRLSRKENNFSKHAFDLIRHGPPGDKDSTYELKRCDIPDLEKKLLTEAKKGVNEDEIKEAIAAAREIAE